MVASQQSSPQKSLQSARLSVRGRLIAAGVFLLIAWGFLVVNWGERTGLINWGRIFNPCGFKQRTRLPCPTCGMTTAVRLFAVGHFREAFLTQPAAWLLCVGLLVTAAFALVMAVTGREWGVLRWIRRWKLKYVVLVVAIILGAAWAVTMARAISELR